MAKSREESLENLKRLIRDQQKALPHLYRTYWGENSLDVANGIQNQIYDPFYEPQDSREERIVQIRQKQADLALLKQQADLAAQQANLAHEQALMNSQMAMKNYLGMMNTQPISSLSLEEPSRFQKEIDSLGKSDESIDLSHFFERRVFAAKYADMYLGKKFHLPWTQRWKKMNDWWKMYDLAFKKFEPSVL